MIDAKKMVWKIPVFGKKCSKMDQIKFEEGSF